MEKFNFSNDFQDLLLACVIDRHKEFFGVIHLLDAQYFDGRAAFDTAYELSAYYKKYQQIPSFTVLANQCHSRFTRENPDHAKALFDYVSSLKDLDTDEWEAVRDMVRSFMKERAVHNAIKKLISAAETGKALEEDPVKMVEDAVRITDTFDDMGVEIHEDIDLVVDHLKDQTVGIRTGYTLLDDVWPFGWQPGWLIVPLAPPKRYKTTFCINLALQIAGPGFGREADVLYYACEIDQIHAMKRALISATGIPEKEIHEGFNRFREEAKKAVDEMVYGHVLFKSFPSKQATMADIYAHAQQAISVYKMKPKAIFIDYAETVKPSAADKNTPEYRRSADVYTEARALGQKLGVTVIMPDRCKAEVVEKAVPSLNAFQGSFEKAGIVDAAIGLCATDQEKAMGKMRYFIFINRHGAEYGYFEGKVQPDIAVMTIEKEIEFNADEEEEKPQKSSGGKRSRKPGSRSRASTDFVDDANFT